MIALDSRVGVIKKRIFIVGCPRSGTTLLQGILAAHSLIYTLPETHFFSGIEAKSWIKRNLYWPALKTRNSLLRVVNESGRPDLLPMAQISIFQLDYARPFLNVMDRLAEDAGRSIWLEKTPGHIYCIKEIAKRIPGAIFLHIVRDGRDVVASLYEATNRSPEAWASLSHPWLPKFMKFKGYTMAECVEMWNRCISITASWNGKPNHYIVNYENLVSTPQESVESLVRYLDIPFEQEMLDPGRTAQAIIKNGEIWKMGNSGAIKKPERRYDKIFNDAERSWISAHLLPIPAAVKTI